MTQLTEIPAAYRVERAETEIDRIANAHYERMLELNPESATVAGRKGRETEYADYSPAGTSLILQAVRDTLDALSEATPVDNIDEVTLDAMQERLGLMVEMHEAGLGEWEINNLASPVQSIRSVFDLMGRDTAEDWVHLSGRMHNVPDAIAGYIETLEAYRAQGKVAAKRQVETAIEQTAAYITEDGFFAQLAKEIAQNAPELADEAKINARRAIIGYSELNTYLTEALLPEAPVEDAVGKKRYSLYSRQFLGSTINLEETYAWGIEELDRIIAEQQKVAEEIKPGSSIEEAKEVLDADPARTLHGTDALREWMQGLSDAALEFLAKDHFDVGGPMRNLECMIAPTQEGGIYYTPPAADWSRPGRMWWSVPPGEDTFGTWRETSTVYHEGTPGHHLQAAVATAMAGTMNEWRANGVWVSGHGEGWALYAERLMEELGYLSDPGDRMGMLDAQRLRAARVVFDIGVHCGFEIPERWVKELKIEPGIWSAETGKKFLDANLDMSVGQRDFEYVRYLGWPGQAPSYKVGQRIWEQLRDKARAAGISDKDFHTRALKLGSVGLDTLKRTLAF
ncbi:MULTISPECIES: DUF885 domain-containing protein [unclassified Rothia (in: high G+C Gram-positive bacteria)]|uniref:DUF885 domain-containing protein n=1 Tax=unclassified Rothia (in: high G+C Gram-positive bacteria) TaxID=2689056 RepID=UPI00195BBE6D|nr:MULTISPECIES: DUF885 domain-containing protein [unclassified Rothia (in: high G+C Gram-positive bacteria)]MBM7051367.1 DUF885 domain-containing protein [Rothia sp. ZJ1223]QRZ61161.1 DUF885 domain-containing protein [Rothia sp. ZJ932]